MVKRIYNENNNNNKRLVKEGESYGWVVDSSEAWEAYEFACDYLGKDYLDDQIVSSLGTESLAESLEYIFRIHDFNDWKERNNDNGEVTSSNVWEAYDCACEYFGKDNLNDIIVGDLGTDELSDSLAYIFRMNDFRAWKNRNDDEDEDIEESVNVPTYKNKRSRCVTESDSDILDKLGITEKELQIVKDFCDNGNANEEIGFESPKYGMVMITDIFRDEEGDPVFNTIEQAADYYGLENVRNFCKKVLRYTKRIKSESIKVPKSKVDGYAVKIRDMHKGYIHLLEFETEAEADEAYDQLHYIERELDAGNYDDDMDYQFSVQSVFDTAKDFIEEIDWRRSIDKNNVYDYGDGKLQIVNDIAVDLYI